MRLTLSTLIAMVVAAPLSAQAINEQFEYSVTGIFPPAGWTNQLNPGAVTAGWAEPSIQTTSMFWSTLTSDAAGHDDYNSGQYSDATLISPAADLSAYSTPQLTFDEELDYAGWMLHNGNTTAAGVSTIEVSTDGGVTWTVEWTETATSDGYYPGLTVDLAAYAGQPSVELGFHYVGTYAHAWVVDNVVLDNGGNPTGPSLSVSAGAPGGPMTFDFAGYSANGTIAVLYGPAGTFTVSAGSCAGLTLGVQPLNFPPTSSLILVSADGSGNAQLTQNVPSAGAGLSVQAVDAGTCTGSNVIVL